MRTDLFDFELPAERIALRPASPRDSARMLVLEGDAMRDAHVRDLPGLLRAGDCLVFNDTRVIPAQLEGLRGSAHIGATLHKREGPRRWRAFVRNANRLRDGDAMSRTLRDRLPFPPDESDRLLREAHDLVIAGVGAGLIVAVCQGLLGGLAIHPGHPDIHA